MKEISVSLWKVEAEELKTLPHGTQFLVMDPKFCIYSVRTISEKIMRRSLKKRLKFFLFEEPK